MCTFKHDQKTKVIPEHSQGLYAELLTIFLSYDIKSNRAT